MTCHSAVSQSLVGSLGVPSEHPCFPTRTLQPHLHSTQNGLTSRSLFIGNCLCAHDCAILIHTDIYGALPALGEK